MNPPNRIPTIPKLVIMARCLFDPSSNSTQRKATMNAANGKIGPQGINHVPMNKKVVKMMSHFLPNNSVIDFNPFSCSRVKYHPAPAINGNGNSHTKRVNSRSIAPLGALQGKRRTPILNLSTSFSSSIQESRVDFIQHFLRWSQLLITQVNKRSGDKVLVFGSGWFVGIEVEQSSHVLLSGFSTM